MDAHRAPRRNRECLIEEALPGAWKTSRSENWWPTVGCDGMTMARAKALLLLL